MESVAVLLIFCGALLFRQTARGRAGTVIQDTGDFITAAITGDYEAIREVASRTRPSESDPRPDSGSVPRDPNRSGNGVSALLSAALARGNGSSYQWGATGPKEYDCSGLVWRSMQDVGFTGIRFTTATFKATVAGLGWAEKIAPGEASTGDIVLWVGRHIGIVSNGGNYYSALNDDTGIVDIKISAMSGTPEYYRYVRKS